jgi:hypothetical protein
MDAIPFPSDAELRSIFDALDDVRIKRELALEARERELNDFLTATDWHTPAPTSGALDCGCSGAMTKASDGYSEWPAWEWTHECETHGGES